ncbi:MAG: type II toxin-antitoxin system RelE/ParE family toxin [Rhodoferax sp.]|nr:type II toxin-antitoxin system RelE/ParE family toxin [Rhodoferax sp.]
MTKPINWRGSSLKDLRAFPDDARHKAGYQLRKVQQGEQPDEFKPMPDIGAGVNEIIVDTADGWFRVITQSDKDVARRRYGAVLIGRRMK